MEHVKSFCRNCSASCGVELTVEDNRILDIKGDRDHPVSRGGAVKSNAPIGVRLGAG